jgi:hypothetical protein
MQLRNCFDEGMLWLWCVRLLFLFMRLILVVCGFSRDIRAVYASLLFMRFSCLCLACRAWSGYESAGPLGPWVGTKVLDPLRACVKVLDYCDLFSAGILICAKTLVMVLRAFCHCVRMICNSGSFLLFWWGWLGRVCITLTHLIQES